MLFGSTSRASNYQSRPPMMPKVQALVHQGDGPPSPAPPPSLAKMGERATVAPGGGLRASPNRRGIDTTTVSCFRVSLEGCTPGLGTCYFPVFSGDTTV